MNRIFRKLRAMQNTLNTIKGRYNGMELGDACGNFSNEDARWNCKTIKKSAAPIIIILMLISLAIFLRWKVAGLVAFFLAFVYTGSLIYDYFKLKKNLCSRVKIFKPINTTEHFNRGYYYGLKGKHDEAIAEYSKVIELDPKHIKAYLNRGHTYSQIGDYDKAIEDYNLAIELDPKCANAFASRASAYYRKNNCNKAIIDYKKYLELEPDGELSDEVRNFIKQLEKGKLENE